MNIVRQESHLTWYEVWGPINIKEENRQRRRMKILKDYFDQKKKEQEEK